MTKVCVFALGSRTDDPAIAVSSRAPLIGAGLACVSAAVLLAMLAGTTPALAKGKPETPGANGLAIAIAAQEKNGTGQGGGVANARANRPADENADDDDDEEESGKAKGRTVLMTALSGGTASHLRFANLGNSPGRATVIIHDAATGETLGTWTSDLIPGRGALEVAWADIAADASPVVDPLAPLAVAEIRGGFRGHVQQIGFNAAAGQIGDLTSCRRIEAPKRALGYVAAPGRSDVAGTIELINGGNAGAAATLRLYDAATGAELGRWTSPTLTGFAAVSVGVADVVAQTTPAIATPPQALTVALDPPGEHIALAYKEGVTGGVLSDLTAGCPLKGGDSGEATDDDESEDDGSDDDNSEDDESDDDDSGDDGDMEESAG